MIFHFKALYDIMLIIAKKNRLLLYLNILFLHKKIEINSYDS